MSIEVCPLCGANLIGDPVPEKYRHHNIPGDPYYNPNEHTHDEQVARSIEYGLGERCFCLPYGEETTHFSRVIGIEDPTVYDGVIEWMCPDCGGRWPRFTKGHEPYRVS